MIYHTACTGIFNQHLILLSFITLGIASGCGELLIEDSPRRKHSVAILDWVPKPFDSLWDADLLKSFLQGHGIRLLMGGLQADPSVQPLVDFQTLHEHYEDVGDALYALKEHVLSQIDELPELKEVPGGGFSATVEVATNGMFRSLQTASSHLHTEVARHTQIAAHLQSLAQACIHRMHRTGTPNSFIGIHLRIEDDFDKAGRTGGRDSMLAHYAEALKKLQIASDEQLYIASGIFDSEAEPDFAAQHLHRWSSQITHRNKLLSEEETSSLDAEQLAAIDFIIVSKASKFVGWQGSSFSFWVGEERALQGHDSSTSLIINGAAGMDIEHEAFIRSNKVAIP